MSRGTDTVLRADGRSVRSVGRADGRTDGADGREGRPRTPSGGRPAAWHSGRVRYSEFWDLVEDVFGARMGRTLTQDQVLGALGDRTSVQALDDGEDPRTVWRALCDAMDVPAAERWGSVHRAVRPR